MAASKAYSVSVTVVLIALIGAAGVTLYQNCGITACISGRGVAQPPERSFAPGAPVLAVKIDNVDVARPQTGITDAAVVYVEPVEGGLTRLMAVFGAHRPDVVGPVRSARFTDLQLLAQYGRPTLAYSGAAPLLLPHLLSAALVNASPAQAPDAYFRDSSRPAPHNLYLHPARLPEGPVAGSFPAPPTGPLPQGGTPVGQHHVDYRSASYDFRWSSDTRTWLVSMDGTPFRAAESGDQVGVSTVVVQDVDASEDPRTRDAHGQSSEQAQTVGTGAATVLRDGRQFRATWSRDFPNRSTVYTTADGRTLPLAKGPVWILLVPAPAPP
jgi:hypothetical protein